MPEYLFLQRSVPGQSQRPSPAQMQEMHAAFNTWKEKFRDRILDMGAPLEQALEVARESPPMFMPGSSVEVREILQMEAP